MYHSPVVRVFSTHMEMCFDIPWQTKRTQKGTGSGVYLGNNEILTGAHVVSSATFIQVQKLSSPDKVIAQVKSICHDCDLALLTIQDDDFLNDLEAAPLGDLPELRDPVEVVGFPMGGEQVSITNGVVSRIEVNFYSHSWRSLLCATIDAAINPGNSGGPVFNQKREVIGIAFQKNTNAENSGQMVPPPVIKNFLKSAREGQKIVRLPSLGITMQNLENPTLKERFQVPFDQTGLLVTTVDYGSSCSGLIESGDVLHQINEYPISSMGTILYKDKYRTRIPALLSELSEGDMVTLVCRRDGVISTLEIPLKANVSLAPREEGIPNRYFIYAGFVFQPLTRKYLQTWKTTNRAPAALRYFYSSVKRTEDLLELVVLAQVLSDEVNVGYDDFYYEVLTEINGQKIKSLNHLAQILEGCRGAIEIRTLEAGWIVIDGELARERSHQILERYQIPSDQHGVDLLEG